jgi:hypothetical protein
MVVACKVPDPDMAIGGLPKDFRFQYLDCISGAIRLKSVLVFHNVTEIG